ncbi:MAG TPA: tetratricopeptide repeat protein, partial [Candidatus Polarisedimenticolaceae bacterium]|nr:tetratricopeptide repeat protein [Candidatus Polarisedimenticolaceae bacterium]
MTPDAVKSQLSRILTSPQLARAERLARFLKLVVEETLAGNAASIKEYRIGVDVFDRGKTFDPRIDPIVRVQAAKLRARLVEYYAGPGGRDPIVIAIPKGSYAPEITERRARGSVDRSRIAVLPFVNMSGDPDAEHFSDGLSEELINRLACVPGLQVVARTSAFRFKGRTDDLREVGKALDAGVVLEGSVRRAGDQVRVTAQLIDVATGFHLFSRTYQRAYRDVFALQDDVADSVVREIVPGAATPRAREADLDAYAAYLRGMFALSNRFGDFGTARDRFRDALSIDPAYAPAWAGLAHTYWLMAWFYALPAETAMPLAKDAALKTLELDPGSALAHASLGLVESGFEWRWGSAEEHFERAIEFQPSLATIYPFYAVVCLLPQSRLDEACAMTARGLSLDPFNPLFRVMATFTYALSERDADAMRQHALGMEIHPAFPPVHASAGLAHEIAGRTDEAIASFRKAAELAPGVPVPLSMLAHALAAAEQKAEARRILKKLLEHPAKLDLDLARVHLGLG